ncbi:hypothetical protein HDK90DRAFT_356194 [Phyllosticta capitalensis]|uniref:NACHT domain-containing protein n=1 Tax=Phyllosticta capitalensis TaxID=121624 RepID=A0ABR1YIY0_9PEZI
MASIISETPPHSHEDYTVGWICALHLELTAALAMLDDWHEDGPPDFVKPAADENFYQFGRIGKHNVVITCLEAGTFGPVAAASAAKSMVFTFPNIKFGLLVGIGGAIPQITPEGDTIRLGDVAISQPLGINGGVFQHDLMKALPGGQTQSKSFLNKPPGVLLNALNGLKARHSLRPSKVPQFLEELPSKLRKPKEKLAYAFQGAPKDRLFDAKYPHLGGTDCSECESIGEVLRHDRESKDPEFHYGIIASGATLCKDANLRDRIKAQMPDCICIEMEAAGLMNSFPCLVIRGISDYSDSHKNDIWQPYAAATAAAYGKELLGVVQPQAVAGAEKASQIMDHIQNIEHRINEIHQFAKQSTVHLSEHKIKLWLSPPDPSINFNEAIEKHHAGTGSWFLDGEELRNWTRSPNSFIWLYGLAGSGKTVLSSALIQSLKEDLKNDISARPIIYFFFDFKTEEKQSLDKMARSLIYQLFKARPEGCMGLVSLFTECRNGSEQPTRTSLLKTLASLLEAFDEVRMVIDAVEEANQKDKQKLIDWIRTISESRIPSLHFLVSSRQEPDIERALTDIGTSVQISADAVLRDVSLFVYEQIQGANEHGLGKWKSHPEILEDVVEKLSSDAKGMFRLASLRLELLEQCSSVADLSEALNTLPSDINAAYDRVLERIPHIWKERGLRILQFLIYSPQTPDGRSDGLDLYEAAEMLAVDISHKSKYDAARKMINPADIVRFLPCLVEITRRWGFGPYCQEDYPYLQLAHFTVKEYLLSGKACSFFRDGLEYLDANVSLVRTSLAFLDHLSSKELSKELSPELKFGRRASLWIEYGKIVDDNPIACEEILEFFNNTCALETWWVLYTTRNGTSFSVRDTAPGVIWRSRIAFSAYLRRGRGSLPTPLYIAVRFEMLNVVKRLINCDLSQINDDASFWAPTIPLDSSEGSIKQIPFGFYAKGLCSTEVRRETALYVASSVGSKILVRILLDHGAEIGKQGGEAGTALMVARENNHESCVTVLNSRLAKLNENDQMLALCLFRIYPRSEAQFSYSLKRHWKAQ